MGIMEIGSNYTSLPTYTPLPTYLQLRRLPRDKASASKTGIVEQALVYLASKSSGSQRITCGSLFVVTGFLTRRVLQCQRAGAIRQ
jgi:hypothetical protein